MHSPRVTCLPTIAEPPSAGAGTLDHGYDYADAFEVHGVAGPLPSAERFLRGVLEGAPAADRWAMQAVWRGVLGLGLRRVDDPGAIVGWQVVSSTPGQVVLAAPGGLIDGCLVARCTSPHSASLATFVRYRRPGAAWVWAVVGRQHRRFVPALLRRWAGAASRG